MAHRTATALKARLMKLTDLCHYPVKSMRGIRSSAAAVGSRGLQFDREWLLAAPDGTFLSARKLPQLLLWQAEADETALTLTAPDGTRLHCPAAAMTETADAAVWQDRFPARCGNAEADRVLSRLLKTEVRLFRLDDTPRRLLRPQQTPLSFADGAPLLLTSLASLADLNSRLDSPVEMERFRANLVADGKTAYAEESWQRIRIGSVEFEYLKPCIRCVMTTIDLRTAEKHPRRQPLATLAQTRKAVFGIYLTALGSGTVRVGDAVEVLSFR